ncbi:putative TonB-dependent outer membrane receptor [Flavobacterium psychrophilum]|uniref:TonB-dependent receptor n=1 Tax=Flavobacterium psychrophilum TaxID=96345 RepID=UPI000B7C2EED|nr:TonB-dependent receptor [Flavobacterium psychrophilum]SNB11754.1 putative TonB-dependent outer membrane receptor [Flavobacterium psychrophilum]
MSKIYFLLLTLFFSFPNKLFSQVTISGQIADKNNKPIEFLEIQLQNKDSIIVKSELTYGDGKFTIATVKGEYQLLIKQLGKILQQQKISAIQDLNLGIIEVTENPQQLKEVTVTSKKKLIERKVDRLVFNVENSISASSGDALDALKVTPNIRVDNDEISIIGKSNVLVMVDDRLMQLSGEDLTNFLKTIPANSIKNIEVIKTPPAKYDANGNSGLVNINLKKVKKGEFFKASINSAYQQGTKATGSIGGNVTSQIKKVSIYSNLNYKDGANQIIEDRQYHYPTKLWIGNSVRKRNTNILSGRVGFDYKQNNKNELGVLYFGSSTQSLDNSFDNIKIYTNQNQPTGFYTKTDSKTDKNDYFHSVSTHFKRTIDTLGKSITASFDYLIINQETNRKFNTNSFVDATPFNADALTNGNQNIKITTSNIDVELPYSKIKYAFGGKISFIDTNNNFNYFDVSTGVNIIDFNQSNEFNYAENTQALYLSAQKSIKKWEFNIGLRGENTQTKGYSKTLNQTNTNAYFKIYPTFYATYTANKKNIFSLNYSRRVGRPSYNMTNPFRTYYSNFSYLEGNPFIQPDFSNNIEVSHTYDNNLNTSIALSYYENGKSQILLSDPVTNISKLTYLNFFKAFLYSLNLDYTFKKWDWLESNNSANLFYRKTIANELLNNQIVEKISYAISSNNTFLINKSKTFLSSLEFSYRSPQIMNIFLIKETFNTNVSFRYLMLNKNLQISLNFFDIFKTNAYKSDSYSNDVLLKARNYSDSQYSRISALYKFGNKKINVKESKSGNEAELGRAK